MTGEASYELPPELLDEPETLLSWAGEAVAVARRIAAEKKAKDGNSGKASKAAKTPGKPRPGA